MRKTFIMLAAGAAMAAGPALAQDSNNGRQNREQARQSSQGPSNADQRGVRRSNENSVLNGGQSGMRNRNSMEQPSMRRQNSQGRANANERARERANQNSAVANVQPGMMVHDRNNRMVGRVRDVRRAPDGTIIAIVVVVVVQVSGSNVVTLPAGSFTVVNNVVIVNNINLNVGG
jgi:hypothetical protein